MDERPQPAPDAARDADRPGGPATLPANAPWLAHYSPGVPHQVAPPRRSLPELLDESARRHSARDAVIYYGTRLTYVQLAGLINRFAQALLRLGVRRGDRVALALPNVPQFPIAFYGILKAGAIAVPTNPIYTPPELRHQLNDSGARAIVMLDQFYPTLAGIRGETPIEHVILAGVADYFSPALALGYRLRQARAPRAASNPPGPQGRRQARRALDADRPDARIHGFKQLLGADHDRRGFEVYALPQPARPDDVAVLQYTGGTTGLAKGAMLTHSNLASNALQAWTWSEQAEGGAHRTLCVAPFFHSYGMTICLNVSLFHGATMVLLPRFTARDVVAAIEKYQPDLFPGVPTMYLAISTAVKGKRANLRSVQVCISGAAPLPAQVQEDFEALTGARVVEGYGLTEASPVTHCNPVHGERRSGTIGLPLPNTVAAIVNPDTWEFLPPGQDGEIVVRGPQVMRGYWKRPDETAAQIRDGWLRTGDVGAMDADGYFRIVDRAKDLIIAGGYNIYPREVEEVLYQHPMVQEACVIGVPDAYRGETVRAYIVPKPGQTITAEELTAFCRERLAPYKVPRQYEFRASLPKTLIGKVLRRALREEALAQTQAAAGGAGAAPA